MGYYSIIVWASPESGLFSDWSINKRYLKLSPSRHEKKQTKKKKKGRLIAGYVHSYFDNVMTKFKINNRTTHNVGHLLLVTLT